MFIAQMRWMRNTSSTCIMFLDHCLQYHTHSVLTNLIQNLYYDNVYLYLRSVPIIFPMIESVRPRSIV